MDVPVNNEATQKVDYEAAEKLRKERENKQYLEDFLNAGKPKPPVDPYANQFDPTIIVGNGAKAEDVNSDIGEDEEMKMEEVKEKAKDAMNVGKVDE